MTITLQLSPDIQSKLESLAALKGQKIEVAADYLFRQAIESADQSGISTAAFPPNENALAAFRLIAKMQEGMRHTDGSQTDRLIREGRSGGMYSDTDAIS